MAEARGLYGHTRAYLPRHRHLHGHNWPMARKVSIAEARNHLTVLVHDVERGASISGLYSLVATCEARQINPFDYRADVLARVQDHPKSAVDELLPGAWAAARDEV